jgi:hypothetical protein
VTFRMTLRSEAEAAECFYWSIGFNSELAE